MLRNDHPSEFDPEGFVPLPQVFQADQVQELLAAVGELSARGHATPDARSWWTAFHDGARTPHAQLSEDHRNVAMQAEIFADLVDAEVILVPIIQILGPRIAML